MKIEHLYYHGNPEEPKKKIGVFGSSDANTLSTHALKQAEQLGQEIIKEGGVLVTGATEGYPLWTAMGAKKEKGLTIGISPAANDFEHKEVYRLPNRYLDLVIYSGFGYPGKDLLFTRTCDAIIIGSGRADTIHQFVMALESKKVIGILEGEWGLSGAMKEIVSEEDNVVFDSNPKNLVKKVIDLL